MSTIVNRRDLDFQLYEVLNVQQLFQSERYAAFDRETIDEMFNGAQALAEETFLPIAGKLDANEPRFEDGSVVLPPEVEPALKAYAEAGFFAAGFEHDIGGLQMPYVVQTALNGMFSAANNSLYSFPMLTLAAANMLNAFGSPAQKRLFLPPMLQGLWYGTMCLSETQAGSSLADIRTTARPRADGTYAISGTKMWISAGEHEVSENIIHMVLAKRPDAPTGVKGISLFIVPKFRVDADGTSGARNNIILAGLNHKMGQRGLPNTVLNFGEGGETIGFLVGEPNQGLRYMFHMMNEARILVGQGATMLGLTGFLHSLDYAKTRRQGRLPGDKGSDSAPVPIIEHADVRRMLLAQKANVEGALALILYCALLVDRIKVAPDESERRELHLLLEILTPIAKSWPSEFCLEANKWAIQVLGGYGYTRDYPLERFYRDNRLNPIHEGTYGIQGIDLLSRKVSMQDGRAFDVLVDRIARTLEKADDRFAAEKQRLASCVQLLTKTTRSVLDCGDGHLRIANATLYLDAVGHIVVAWLWLKQALAAVDKERASAADRHFYAGKLAAMRFFFRYELPRVVPVLELVASLDRTSLDVDVADFAPE